MKNKEESLNKKKKKSVLKKILIGFSSFLLACLVAVLIFTEIPVCINDTSVCDNSSSFLRDCASLNANFNNVKLTEMSLLGSHDALSNDINFNSASNTSEDNITNNGFVRFIAKGLMVRLSKAQNENIYDQLTHGVRYIDTRITYVNNVYYNSHGLISNTFESNLNLILKFLDENPGEFILMHIVKYYQDTSNWNELETFIQNVKYNGKSLFDYVNYDVSTIHEFSSLTYGNITDNGSKAGAVIFTDLSCDNPRFVISNKIYSEWHNILSHDEIVEKYAAASEEGKRLGNAYLRVNQTQQTPSTKDIFGVITCWSLLKLAREHNYRVLQLNNIDELLNNLPIYMCDFSTSNSHYFNRDILAKLKARNITLA